MKIIKLVLVCAVFVGFLSQDALARKINLDHHVTSSDGCEWHITGWVDVSLEWGWPPISIDGYDVTMSGPCGTHHFQGLAIPPDEPGDDPTVEGEWVNEAGEVVEAPDGVDIVEILALTYEAANGGGGTIE